MPKRIFQAARMPTAVDLKDLTLGGQTTRSALEYQKRAMEWVEHLSARAAAQVDLHFPQDGFSINLFDCFRSELKAQGGQALANVERARSLKSASSNVFVHGGWLEPDPQRLNHILADKNRSRITRLIAQAQGLPTQIRQRLYRKKIQMQRKHEDRATQHTATLDPKKYPILALPREPAHIHDISPVEVALREDHGLELAYIAINRTLENLIHANSRMIFNIRGTGRFSADLFARLKTFVAVQGPKVPGFETLESLALTRTVLEVIRNNLIELDRFATGFVDILNQSNAKILIVGNPYTMEGRVAAVAAKARSVKVVASEHGTILFEDPNWQSCILDQVFVWGAPSKRSLLSCGVSEEQIVITGSARTDRIVEETKHGKSDQNPIILVASSGAGNQVSASEHRQFIETLFNAARKRPDIRWLIKLHKKDRPHFYLKGPSPKPENIELVQGEYKEQGKDIFHYLRRARALLTIYSTSALDAMLVDVPVMCFVLPNTTAEDRPQIEFIERGAIHPVNDASHLATIAQELWDGNLDERIHGQAKTYIQEHYANLGEAAHTIARHIFELTI